MTSYVNHLSSHVRVYVSTFSRLLSPVHVSCLTSPVSCLTSYVLHLMSHISCPTSHISCLTYTVSHLLSRVSRLTSPVSNFLSQASWITSHVLRLMPYKSCLSCLLSHVFCQSLQFPVSSFLS